MIAVKGTWGIVLALSACASLNANITGTPMTEFRQSYALNPNGRIVVQNLYGDVEITAWDRDMVQVQAIKRSTDPRRLDDAHIVVDSSSTMVSIRTQYAGADAEHPASVDYRIMVPRTANLENVKLINGGLSISGVSGPIKASSVTGVSMPRNWKARRISRRSTGGWRRASSVSAGRTRSI
jgi:hypothetical protein